MPILHAANKTNAERRASEAIGLEVPSGNSPHLVSEGKASVKSYRSYASCCHQVGQTWTVLVLSDAE